MREPAHFAFFFGDLVARRSLLISSLAAFPFITGIGSGYDTSHTTYCGTRQNGANSHNPGAISTLPPLRGTCS